MIDLDEIKVECDHYVSGRKKLSARLIRQGKKFATSKVMRGIPTWKRALRSYNSGKTRRDRR